MKIQTDYIHQYWQNQILTQFGITRWACFDTSIIELNIENLAESLDFSPAILPNLAEQQSADTLQIIAENVTIDEPIYLDKLDNIVTVDESNTVVLTNDDEIVNKGVVIDKFHLQMAVIQDWIIVADMKVLLNDTKQQSLWQNLLNHLHLTPDDLIFPIVWQAEQYALSYNNQQMCTNFIALAMFKGKVCALNQTKNHKIGCVTPLPDVLEDKQIHTFPTLENMLNDFQQKRAFWQQLKGMN